MKSTLLRLVLFTLLFAITPAPVLHAQSSADTAQGDHKGKKGDKKDDKKDNKDDAVVDNPDVAFFSVDMNKFNPAFFARLLIDIFFMAILIRFIYLPVYKRRDHLFTFFMFNVTIFMITYLLSANKSLSTGAAFGMFAVFSLLRYRTEDISARDMTYLFKTIALGLMSSINRGNIVETITINAIILIIAFLLDGNILIKTEFVKTVQYENIELIKPGRYHELISDLKLRTGLNVHKVSIGRIDFLRDTATIKIYYHEGKNQDADFSQTSENAPNESE
ncbi:MAG TPA: DUF4956 domain-containing protein [Bacteroidia bacterium]|nr:DUF4956 domain-containing protein [Bacteroidia bacterium]